MQFIYSQPSIDSLIPLLAEHYDGLHNIISCEMFYPGLHDNYLVRHDGDSYILRIYRNEWRSADEIGFELDWLEFLHGKNLPVAFPLLTREGKRAFTINCAEGKRQALIFPYASGRAPGNELNIEQARLLGSTVAELHQASSSFVSSFNKQILDIPYLLDKSIKRIEPFLELNELKYMEELQLEIRNALAGLPKLFPCFTVCAGDINPGNFHIDAGSKLTLFDFDQCGYGFRAFDIGKFYSSIISLQNKELLLAAFLEGYQQISELEKIESDSIRDFAKIGIIWVMAIHVANISRIGTKMLHRQFWMRRLEILKSIC